MTGRFRAAMAMVPSLMLLAIPAAFGQVPAGVPYDAAKHANPIVTWVNEKDFQKVSFAEAAKRVGVELMSLSAEVGERQFVELAVPSSSRQKLRIANEEFEVTFFPVMRQTYRLKSGKAFVLYTFRFPLALTSADVLNAVAFERPPRDTTPRFGSMPLPDRIEIRGYPGLYFDNHKGHRTTYWFEMGAGYAVTTNTGKEDLFKVLEDLL